ncbi:MAG: sulfatase [Trueperaceae bacterium]|nr:sulfatase [Trueperaceae bacterium]
MKISTENPLNVLWIMADQLRYHALSSSGDPNISTPNIDRLAAEGLRCTAAFSQYPVCGPFRASLMTGLHATSSGTLRHGDFLDPGLRTVADSFKDAGYQTSYVGKWHLAPETGAHMVSPEGWIGQSFWVHPKFRGGFEDWFGFNVSNNYFETYIATGEKISPQRLEGYQTDALTDISLEYLAKKPEGQPWFHVISYESPHPGFGGNPRSRLYPVPEPYESQFDPVDIILRDNVPEEHQQDAKVQMAGYYRLITNLDANVGRVLDWLDYSGQADKTLVVFFSDHGEMGGSQGLKNKQVPYEESLHIPLIWRLPGKVPGGIDYDNLICGLDIYPTSAGFCNIPIAEKIQGLDYSDVLAAARTTALREDVLVQWESPRFAFGDHPYRAIRTSTHTYAVGRDANFCLLFDHEQDPWEKVNKFWESDSQELRKVLHHKLEKLIQHSGEEPPDYLSKYAV